MQQEDLINDILTSAALARVSIPEACRYAGVAPSTFYRWKAGSAASVRRINAVRKAIDAIAGLGSHSDALAAIEQEKAG